MERFFSVFASVCVDRDELPTFRFGNGHKDRALSRASLSGTSLGTIHFYVLGGMAKGTPPLIGPRTLRGKNAMLSYADGLFRYHEPNEPGQLAVQMQALTSGHLTIDLAFASVCRGTQIWDGGEGQWTFQ